MTLASLFLTFAAVLSVTPVPRDAKVTPNYAWWQRRLEAKAELVKAGGARVVFLGDSITHFFEDPVSHGRGGGDVWKAVWSQPPYRALDLGFSGDRTEHLLWRITEGGELDGYEAKAIVLMIGTNNFGQRKDEPPMDVITGISRILETIRAKQPKARTILCAIFPRGADRKDPYRKKIDTVNREIAKFADGKSVIWCDFTDDLLEPDGSLARETMPDLLHPSPKGYRIWTDAVRPMVDDILRGDGLPVGPRCSEKHLMAEPETFPSAAVTPHTRIMHRSWRGQNWWGERFARNRDFIADHKGKIDLVFAGDSITHFWESESMGAKAYAELTNRYSVLNCGYGGDQTQEVLWRFRNGELDGYETPLVMLMIGTNNNGIGGYDPAHTAAGVKACLDEIARRQPQAKVLLCGYLPRAVGTKDGDVTKDNGANQRNLKTTELIRAYADGKKVIFLDMYGKFMKDGKLPKALMDDFIHPTEAGYRIWLETIRPYL